MFVSGFLSNCGRKGELSAAKHETWFIQLSIYSGVTHPQEMELLESHRVWRTFITERSTENRPIQGIDMISLHHEFNCTMR